jgi:hypothetical protein
MALNENVLNYSKYGIFINDIPIKYGVHYLEQSAAEDLENFNTG